MPHESLRRPQFIMGGAYPSLRMTAPCNRDGTADDAELIGRMAGGDTIAFGEFYDRHSTLLFSIAFKVVNDMQEAEEVLQDAARTIWENSPGYNTSLGRPASWAVVITRNKAIDRLRVLKRKNTALANLTTIAAEDFRSHIAQAPVGTDDKSELLIRALASLPPEQRLPIELAFFQGLTQTEIAAHLAQPLGTIKARIRRGMITMRDALEDQL